MMPPKQDFTTFFAGHVEAHKAHLRRECTKHQKRLPWLIGAIRTGIDANGQAQAITHVIDLRSILSLSSSEDTTNG